jgi:predicted Rossmann fold nucleotide-binding protein DprA/Smf involved in DNA uptake
MIITITKDRNLLRIMIIVSGGQSGVDRAALDIAIKHNIEYKGFFCRQNPCEDLSFDELTKQYPALLPIDSADLHIRTRLNVELSDITVVFEFGKTRFSVGSECTKKYAVSSNKRLIVFNMATQTESDVIAKLIELLNNSKNKMVNIAGVRRSEYGGEIGRAHV